MRKRLVYPAVRAAVSMASSAVGVAAADIYFVAVDDVPLTLPSTCPCFLR